MICSQCGKECVAIGLSNPNSDGEISIIGSKCCSSKIIYENNKEVKPVEKIVMSEDQIRDFLKACAFGYVISLMKQISKEHIDYKNFESHCVGMARITGYIIKSDLEIASDKYEKHMNGHMKMSLHPDIQNLIELQSKEIKKLRGES